MAVKKIGYAKFRLNPLKKITALAKKIRAKKPAMKWTDAIKQASKSVKIGAVKKPTKKVVKKPVKKTIVNPVKKSVTKTKTTKKIIGQKTITKKTMLVNESINQLQKYGEFCRLEILVLKMIAYNRSKIKGVKDAKIKAANKKNTVQLQKQLAAVKKQKAIQKTLI